MSRYRILPRVLAGSWTNQGVGAAISGTAFLRPLPSPTVPIATYFFKCAKRTRTNTPISIVAQSNSPPYMAASMPAELEERSVQISGKSDSSQPRLAELAYPWSGITIRLDKPASLVVKLVVDGRLHSRRSFAKNAATVRWDLTPP